MSLRRIFLLVILSIATTSCCQALWLQVTRRADGPNAPIVLPQPEPGPIPVPRKLDNRFLTGKTMSTTAHAYTDHLDPRNDAGDESAIALAGLDAIWSELGTAAPRLDVLVDPTSTFHAQAKASRELGKTEFASLEVPDAVAGVLDKQPMVARVDYETIDGKKHTSIVSVFTCEGIEPPKLFRALPWNQSPWSTVPSQAPQTQNPCGSTSSGTRVVLLPPLVALKTDGHGSSPVEVTFGNNFELSRSLLTFVHLSDTQLRDADVKLTDPVASAQLDHLVESFEHDEDQELYGPDLAEALVSTINEEIRSHADTPEAPAFVIHTGDSVDSNTMRELKLFHEIMDRLTVPWFNLIGNHDVLAFGNFLPAGSDDKNCVSQRSVIAPYIDVPRWLVPSRLCVPEKIIGHTGPDDTFVAKPSHADGRAAFIGEHARHQLHAKFLANGTMEACSDVLLAGVHDAQHGFDLHPAVPDPKHPGQVLPHPGYYAFRLDLAPIPGEEFDRRAIFIALNTEDLGPNEGGNAGRIGDTQLAWLHRVMACAQPHDLVFMFAHHQLGEIKVTGAPSLRAHPVITSSKNLVGYFYGHNHLHGICREKNACKQFWELESGSLIEHPQEGRLVRLKTIGAGLGILETVVFTERLADPTSAFAKRVSLARHGADHDRCLRDRCSADDRVRRTDGAFTNARLFFRLP